MRPKGRFTIGRFTIGRPDRAFIIAEAGVNHNGSLQTALRLVDAAARSGADAVKFQTFRADDVAAASAPKARYQRRNTSSDESQLEMIRRLELPQSAFRTIAARCKKRGIVFLSTPFDFQSADFLVGIGVPAIKIPSGEITNLPFLRHLGGKRLPVILSTGMSTLAEVRIAIAALRSSGARKIALLHCVSNYPASPGDANIRAMKTMADAFDLPVGYSDHTEGIEVSLAAAALGATILEKHFTLSRAMPGPDHKASLTVEELRRLVRGVRTVEAALGHGRKQPTLSEEDTARVARRSIVTARSLPAGARVDREALAILRPGTGISPARLEDVIGRRARIDIPAGTLVDFKMLR